VGQCCISSAAIVCSAAAQALARVCKAVAKACAILGRLMPDESTTPDLAELTRRAIEAAGRRDFDAAMSFYTGDSVWMGTFRGVDLIRRDREQWMKPYEHFEIEIHEIRDMGCGVILSVQNMAGRLWAPAATSRCALPR
jgi:hypothetical protein